MEQWNKTGVMEQWNVGMMGFKKWEKMEHCKFRMMEYWNDGTAKLWNDAIMG
jgi:hypothetical protein